MKTFKVAVIRHRNDIGVGIERYNKTEVEFFGSYYLQVSEFSRRDCFRFVLDKIREQLDKSELATIRIADPSIRHKRTWHSHHTNIKVLTYPIGRFKNAHLLCVDALERKTIIEEVL